MVGDKVRVCRREAFKNFFTNVGLAVAIRITKPTDAALGDDNRAITVEAKSCNKF